jgi:hypothetical protein
MCRLRIIPEPLRKCEKLRATFWARAHFDACIDEPGPVGFAWTFRVRAREDMSQVIRVEASGVESIVPRGDTARCSTRDAGSLLSVPLT